MRLGFPIVLLILAGGAIAFLIYDYVRERTEHQQQARELRSELSTWRSESRVTDRRNVSTASARRNESTTTDTGEPGPLTEQSVDGSTLVLRTEPTGAMVTAESDTLGTTPMTRSGLETGVVRLRFTRSGYAPADTFIVLALSRPETVAVELEPSTTETLAGSTGEDASRSGSASISDGSVESELPIDSPPIGEESQPTDEPVASETGASASESTGSDVLGRSESDEASPAVEGPPPRTLGTIRIQVRPWGSIRAGDSLLVESTDRRYETQISSGSHWIHLSHPVLGHFFRPVQISPSARTDVDVDLTALNRLAVRSIPSPRYVYVDGYPTGLTTPCLLRLPDGTHRIAVGTEPAGSPRAERSIEVGPGDPTTLTVRLNADSTALRAP